MPLGSSAVLPALPACSIWRGRVSKSIASLCFPAEVSILTTGVVAVISTSVAHPVHQAIKERELAAQREAWCKERILRISVVFKSHIISLSFRSVLVLCLLPSERHKFRTWSGSAANCSCSATLWRGRRSQPQCSTGLVTGALLPLSLSIARLSFSARPQAEHTPEHAPECECERPSSGSRQRCSSAGPWKRSPRGSMIASSLFCEGLCRKGTLLCCAGPSSDCPTKPA